MLVQRFILGSEGFFEDTVENQGGRWQASGNRWRAGGWLWLSALDHSTPLPGAIPSALELGAGAVPAALCSLGVGVPVPAGDSGGTRGGCRPPVPWALGLSALCPEEEIGCRRLGRGVVSPGWRRPPLCGPELQWGGSLRLPEGELAPQAEPGCLGQAEGGSWLLGCWGRRCPGEGGGGRVAGPAGARPPAPAPAHGWGAPSPPS